jgi:hypothetical protein
VARELTRVQLPSASCAPGCAARCMCSTSSATATSTRPAARGR